MSSNEIPKKLFGKAGEFDSPQCAVEEEREHYARHSIEQPIAGGRRGVVDHHVASDHLPVKPHGGNLNGCGGFETNNVKHKDRQGVVAYVG